MNDKKSKIFNATYKLLNDNNISNITVAKIAKEANIGKGTIYEYFSSKEEIYLEAIKTGMEYYLSHLDNNIFRCEDSFEENLLKFIDFNLFVVNQNKSFFSMIINNPKSMINDKEIIESLQNEIKEFKNHLFKTIEKLLITAKEKNEIQKIDDLRLHILFPMLFSFILRISGISVWCGIRKDINIEKEKEELLHIIINLFS